MVKARIQRSVTLVVVGLLFLVGCRAGGRNDRAREARFHLTPTNNIVSAQRTYVRMVSHDPATGTAALYVSPPGLVVVRASGDYVEDTKRFRLERVTADGIDLTFRFDPDAE